MSVFRFCAGPKLSFEHNSDRKNRFLTAPFCWDSGLFLREVDQKYKFGGTFVYGDSYLDILFVHFWVFRLYALLHDAAGAVGTYSDKGLGYCYMTERGSVSCLLGDVTRQLFCLYVKVFVPSIFKSVDFWCSISCIVIDIEPAYENVSKECGVFTDETIQGYSFRPPKKYKPTKQAFWCTRNFSGIVQNSGHLKVSELSNILPRYIQGEYFAKRAEKRQILDTFLEKWLENLDEHGCPKVQNLVDERKWIYSSSSVKHKTTFHYAEHMTKLFGNWIMDHLML